MFSLRRPFNAVTLLYNLLLKSNSDHGAALAKKMCLNYNKIGSDANNGSGANNFSSTETLSHLIK